VPYKDSPASVDKLKTQKHRDRAKVIPGANHFFDARRALDAAISLSRQALKTERKPSGLTQAALAARPGDGGAHWWLVVLLAFLAVGYGAAALHDRRSRPSHVDLSPLTDEEMALAASLKRHSR